MKGRYSKQKITPYFLGLPSNCQPLLSIKPPNLSIKSFSSSRVTMKSIFSPIGICSIRSLLHQAFLLRPAHRKAVKYMEPISLGPLFHTTVFTDVCPPSFDSCGSCQATAGYSCLRKRLSLCRQFQTNDMTLRSKAKLDNKIGTKLCFSKLDS